jgi:hypothetical protein
MFHRDAPAEAIWPKTSPRQRSALRYEVSACRPASAGRGRLHPAPPDRLVTALVTGRQPLLGTRAGRTLPEARPASGEPAPGHLRNGPERPSQEVEDEGERHPGVRPRGGGELGERLDSARGPPTSPAGSGSRGGCSASTGWPSRSGCSSGDRGDGPSGFGVESSNMIWTRSGAWAGSAARRPRLRARPCPTHVAWRIPGQCRLHGQYRAGANGPSGRVSPACGNGGTSAGWRIGRREPFQLIGNPRTAPGQEEHPGRSAESRGRELTTGSRPPALRPIGGIVAADPNTSAA